MLLCYFVFDVFDRMRRNRDIELGNETEMAEFQDEYEKVDNEDSETDESIVSEEYPGLIIVSEEQGVTIDNFESAYFTNGKDLSMTIDLA